MRIVGKISNAASESPISGAKVVLHVDTIELATLHTSREGKFELELDLDKFKGRKLICKVSKKGFITNEATIKVEEDDLVIDLELMAEKQTDEPPPPQDSGHLVGVTELRSIRDCLAAVGSMLFNLVASGLRLAKTRKFKNEPVEQLMAIIMGKRIRVSNIIKGRFKTNYFTDLQFTDGRRQEYKVQKRVYGRLAPKDEGVAYIKRKYLIGFRRAVTRTGLAEHRDNR